MSRNEPNFGDLPAELANETDPKKIAAYYAKKAQEHVTTATTELRTEAEAEIARRTAAPPKVDLPKTPSNADFWNNPKGAVEDTIKNAGIVTREEFGTLTSSLQRNAIATAEMVTARGKEFWAKYEGEIKAMMGKMPPHMQADPMYWEHAYTTVLGGHAAELVAEGKRLASLPSSEQVLPGTPSLEPESKQALSPEQKKVMARLGLSEEQYRHGQKMQEEGAWPLQSLK